MATCCGGEIRPKVSYARLTLFNLFQFLTLNSTDLARIDVRMLELIHVMPVLLFGAYFIASSSILQSDLKLRRLGRVNEKL